MKEHWMHLDDLPGYAVSDQGNVMNTTTDLVKTLSKNQVGIAIVNCSVEGRQHIRSVAVLVANAFLTRDNVPEHFDTPIHLNGNREDCSVINLAWRPRWFAIRYHQQFNPHQKINKGGFSHPVELTNTGEIFQTSWEAATKYGLLDSEILIATMNRTYVFPYNFFFRELEPS